MRYTRHPLPAARGVRPAHRRRGGAVIIVVLSLLTTLTFLGLFFYNWTSQEAANARNFAESEIRMVTRINPNPLFDAAAEQLIVGTKSDYLNSILWGGMHSMLAHQIGQISPDLKPTDPAPRSGQGITMRYAPDANGLPELNPDGTPVDLMFRYDALDGNTPTEYSLDDMVLVHARMAQNANKIGDAFDQNVVPRYHPDVDYTYPDFNTMFLGHESTQGDYKINIPSFFRPQLFPKFRSTNASLPTELAFLNLYSDPLTLRKVFHPHKSYTYPNGKERYLTIASGFVTPQSGNRNRILGEFPFPDDAAKARMGIFNDIGVNKNDYSLLDVDLDGDGVKDSIWMDLDLSMLELPGGRQVMPLVSFRVLDADGLLNLNAHGNQKGTIVGRNHTEEDSVSVSNLGMSRSEVNPTWALLFAKSGLDPGEIAEAVKNAQDAFNFNTEPSATQLANMELAMMLRGWRPSNGDPEIVGRYGDRANLKSNATVAPGASGTDDDGDNGISGMNPVTNLAEQVGGFGQRMPANYVDNINGRYDRRNRLNVSTPSFIHPLSPAGLGLKGFGTFNESFLVDGTSGATRGTAQLSSTPANPAVWLRYNRFQTLGSSDYPVAFQSNPADYLSDAENETILETTDMDYGVDDAPYGAGDSAFLQLGKGDLYKSGTGSRLGSLASANFQHAEYADEIRRQFTTQSWDRLSPNAALSPMRAWEWNTTSGELVFPGEVVLSGASSDPFRPEIRQLFRTEVAQDLPAGENWPAPRQRLNINKILSNDSAAGGEAAFLNGKPNFRPLMPHPTKFTGTYTGSVLATNPIPHHNGAPPVPFNLAASNPYAQEWWARYDRQRLARDIYCLLYLLGIQDNQTVTPQIAREMAQFAVNVVDAIDSDSNITMFEYDENPLDGWSTSGPWQTVYGVEHQELSFSEVLFIRSLANPDEDLKRTEYDEEDSTNKEFDQYHSFVELRNAAPWSVNISNQQWRIRRLDYDNNAELFKVALKDGDKGHIPAGGEYLISCQGGLSRFSGGQYRPSDFRFDLAGAAGSPKFDLIVPNKFEETINIPTPSLDYGSTWKPECDLDLAYLDHENRYVKDSANPFLINSVTATAPPAKVRLVLERRLTIDGDNNFDDNTKNPWVEVDRIEGDVHLFNPKKVTDTPSDLDTELAKLKSHERREPFDSGVSSATITPPAYTNGGADPKRGMHSMPFRVPQVSGQDPDDLVRRNYNNGVTGEFKIWQPHFDRELSSTMELLSIPLYGNFVAGDDTWSIAVNGGATKNVALPGDPLTLLGHRVAMARMLFPQGIGEDPPLPGWYSADVANLTDAEHYRNRWYRLLEFVEVKSQDQLYSEELAALPRRTPGKLNLNTIRHEAVLAGLIDDPYHINPIERLDAVDLRNSDPLTQDLLESGRVWFNEHLKSRDGRDLFLANAGVTNVYIPGGLRSRPFRSLGYLDAPDDDSETANRSLQSTLLRQRPLDSTPENSQSLYEARIASPSALDEVDHHTRQRILAKIANNSTTRSHVFFVWVGLNFFEAHKDGTYNLGTTTKDVIQLGAEATDLPKFRMFCVVDMSRLEEAYDVTTGTFDFRKFIIHRQLLP